MYIYDIFINIYIYLLYITSVIDSAEKGFHL